MENQVSPETVKPLFDKVLTAVQESAKERVAGNVGCIMEALVEEVNEKEPNLLNGRLSNNTIVHFPGTPDQIGQIVTVKLEEAHGFYYTGHIISATE